MWEMEQKETESWTYVPRHLHMNIDGGDFHVQEEICNEDTRDLSLTLLGLYASRDI